MEFDQAYAGAADWNFPSPSATPTAANYSNQAFQTPKTSTFPSHFQDAFTTPQMPSYGTPQQPRYQSATPVQRPQSSSDTLRSNYYAAVQVQGEGQNISQSFPATHGAQAGGMWNGGMVQASPVQPGYIQYDPAQMQTPPPTRGASVKKPQHMQSVAFGTPSTIASRRFVSPQQEQHGIPTTMSLPQQHQRQPQTSMQFPVLQFPPEMQQFGNTGPATAPVTTQSHNFWDSQPGSATLGQPIMLDDPFGLNAQHQQVSWSPNPAGQMPQYNAQQVNFNTPAMDSFPIQHPHPRPASAASATLPSSSMVMLQPPATAGIDPSQIYSSPLRPNVRTNSRTSKTRPTMEQVNNSRRDSVASGSSALSSSLSTSLRRSNTTGTARPRSTNPAESLSRSNSITQAPRTASPLKRMGKTPLGPIAETKPRAQIASVILTIDENGRARTQTTRNAGSNSPTKTARERYPGLFDSDSSDDDSDGSAEPPSRNASFSFTRGEERRSKVARLDAPIENLEGLSLPRSHSSASVRVAPSRAAIAAAAQLKRQGSARKPATSRTRRPLMASASTSSMIDTCPMDFGDRASIGVESTPSLSPEDTGAYASNAHANTSRSMSFPQPAIDQYSGHWHHQQAAPRALPVATQRPLRIRCPCGNTDHCGELLVQCKSCTQYQHPSCVGVDPMFGQPLSYTCFLCTRPTSSMRPKRLGRG